MDKKFQDLHVVDRHDRELFLVIPRECHIISIFFDDDAVRVHYVNKGMFETMNIGYEQLAYNKLIID